MQSRLPVNGAFLASVLSLVVMVVVVLAHLPAVAASVFSFGSGEDEATEALSELVAKRTVELEKYEDRFAGRALFYKPRAQRAAPPPPPPPTRVEVVEPEVDKTPPPPPPPRNYTGPAVIGILGSGAWFEPMVAGGGPLRLGVGDEEQGIELLETNPPWSVKVRYMGTEFELDLFERKDLGFNDPRSVSKSRPAGLIEAEPPAPEVDADAADPAPTGEPSDTDEPKPAEPADDDGDGNEPAPSAGPKPADGPTAPPTEPDDPTDEGPSTPDDEPEEDGPVAPDGEPVDDDGPPADEDDPADGPGTTDEDGPKPADDADAPASPDAPADTGASSVVTDGAERQ